jgi:pyruvate,water dikinase
MTAQWAIADQPFVVTLDDEAARSAAHGAKAANLARARAAGLPVIDGFVIPSAVAAAVAEAGLLAPSLDAVRDGWAALSRNGSDPVVVRSSSIAEDTAASSQAGVFDSVVDVRGWDAFLDAVRTVTRSATRARSGGGAPPLAVLVQRHIDPPLSGVLFTIDPVSGHRDRMVVAVVEGGPQGLVSGAESGSRLVLDGRGRVREGAARILDGRHRRALVRMAKRAEALFDGPQDIEWAIDADGRPLLLQSRPVTAVGAPASGPVFGPGPVAETFPDALQPLEQDLWIAPLRDALRITLRLTGASGRRAIERSPLVVVVDGRPAIDLDLLEGGRARRRGLSLLDPRPPARRLRVAWQVGRLRSALPGLIGDLVAKLDRELRAVPALESLSDATLLLLLERGSAALRGAHGYEMLAGALAVEGGRTGAEAALARLQAGRLAGRTDAEITASDPVVLNLVPPSIGGDSSLPPSALTGAMAPAADVSELGPRESLRLRIRWLHELTARAAATLGDRLARAGLLVDSTAVAGLSFDELVRAVRGAAVVDANAPRVAGPPLPDRFRLTSDGTPVAVHSGGGGGTGGGGGRAAGLVEHGFDPSPGSVLVVDTLDPRLAPVLSRLAGLVSSTGSPLSHLAILARETGVATVVGVSDATRRFPPGTELVVDGGSGEVRVLAPAPVNPAAREVVEP